MTNKDTKYTEEDLRSMSNEELAELGTELDDVTVAYRKERFPLDNDPEEKRASFSVGVWLTIGILAGLAFLGVYLFWPWQYQMKGDENFWYHTLYTPLLGVTAGLSVLSLGFAIIQYLSLIHI